MLQIIDYSDKALAVIGDTRPVKDELRNLGGRFNSRLSCGAGWVFSKRAEPALRDFVAKNGENSQQAAKSTGPEGRVYVGTYAKYNNGDITGAWLKLSDYKDKEDFLRACRELHADEENPELMFQDYEGVPSWLISEDHIDTEVWTYKEEPTQNKAEASAMIEKYFPKKDWEYHKQHIIAAVMVDGYPIFIGKPNIKTAFCFPDEPEDWCNEMLDAAKTWKYFRGANTLGLRETIKMLKQPLNEDYTDMGTYGKVFMCANKLSLMVSEEQPCACRVVCPDSFSAVELLSYNTRFGFQFVPLTEEGRKALLKAYEGVLNGFEKRLKTWWKRYGPEKLHVWSYWADR